MISIIIPFFNAEKYIRRCLNCFIQQTSKNFELILVNDGYEQYPKDIIKDYKESINIQYYSIKHNGVSAARNLGVSKANGNIIGFCDIDDIFNREMIQTVERIFSTKNCDLVVTGVSRLENNELDIKKFQNMNYRESLPNKLSKHEFLYRVLFDKKMYGSVWNKFFKKELIVKQFDENISILEDLLFIFSNVYYKNNINIQFINKPLYCYIDNSASATKNISNLYDKNENNRYIVTLELIKREFAVKDLKKMINSKIFDMAFSEIINKDYVSEIQKRKLIEKCRKNLRNYFFEHTYTYKHRVRFIYLFLKMYLLNYLMKHK